MYMLDENFEQLDFTVKPLQKGDYEDCSFIRCNLSNAVLNEIHFTECCFIDCDLSSASLMHTTFNDVKFKGCKMLGLQFNECNEHLFTITIEDGVLNHSSFYKRKLKKMQFINCTLHEVDFAEADLSNAVFNGCDLKGSIFDNSVLEKADFRKAYNYCIDPLTNKIKKARFSVPAVTGLLYKYDIDIS